MLKIWHPTMIEDLPKLAIGERLKTTIHNRAGAMPHDYIAFFAITPDSRLADIAPVHCRIEEVIFPCPRQSGELTMIVKRTA